MNLKEYKEKVKFELEGLKEKLFNERSRMSWSDLKRLEDKVNRLSIELAEKKYASEVLYTDVNAYEVVRECTPNKYMVREMKCVQKNAEKLRESFSPGGFCGHFDNSLQEWDYFSDESKPEKAIRRHKDGRFYDSDGRYFVIRTTPYKFYDYNF